MAQLSFHSPLGELTAAEEDGVIVALDWGWARDQQATPLLGKAKAQLLDYFAGGRQNFELPLGPAGSAFQRRVWDAMCRIAYGATATYGDLADELETVARPVGAACGRNPIPILIPCHRVVAMNGLGGYSGAGGVATKVALLRLEGALL